MEEFADNVGISKSLVNQIENGHSGISKSTELKVLDYIKKNNINTSHMSKYDTKVSKRMPTVDESKEYYVKQIHDKYSRPYYSTDRLDSDTGTHKPEYYISIPDLSSAEKFVRVYEDSCNSKYQKGDIIAIRAIDITRFFALYRYYIIITKQNRQRLLGLVVPGEKESDITIQFESEMPDVSINREDIGSMYEILGRIEI